MTVTIPEDLAGPLHRRAELQNRTMEDLVREALDWYLRIDPQLFDDMSAWQEVRDEALDLVEGDAT